MSTFEPWPAAASAPIRAGCVSGPFNMLLLRSVQAEGAWRRDEPGRESAHELSGVGVEDTDGCIGEGFREQLPPQLGSNREVLNSTHGQCCQLVRGSDARDEDASRRVCLV